VIQEVNEKEQESEKENSCTSSNESDYIDESDIKN